MNNQKKILEAAYKGLEHAMSRGAKISILAMNTSSIFIESAHGNFRLELKALAGEKKASKKKPAKMRGKLEIFYNHDPVEVEDALDGIGWYINSTWDASIVGGPYVTKASALITKKMLERDA